METFLSVAIGIGLAAACGFRVFVPLLILNLAALSGHLTLPEGFAWIDSTYATLAFTIAMLLEITGYHIPWIDHVLDSIAAAASVIAGTITTAALAADLSPFLKWTTAIIAGGGIAGFVQASTMGLRAKTSLTTGGTGNSIFSTFELGGSIVTSLLAIFIPIVCLILIVLFFIWVARKTGKLLFRKKLKTHN
jgi:glucan phosphoethanolaminetransferase (alkaline phosphatase superfamily)